MTVFKFVYAITAFLFNIFFFLQFLGRYNKFSRELPQTPWILDGKRIFEHSVEELISSKLKDNMHIDGKEGKLYT